MRWRYTFFGSTNDQRQMKLMYKYSFKFDTIQPCLLALINEALGKDLPRFQYSTLLESCLFFKTLFSHVREIWFCIDLLFQKSLRTPCCFFSLLSFLLFVIIHWVNILPCVLKRSDFIEQLTLVMYYMKLISNLEWFPNLES